MPESGIAEEAAEVDNFFTGAPARRGTAGRCRDTRDGRSRHKEAARRSHCASRTRAPPSVSPPAEGKWWQKPLLDILAGTWGGIAGKVIEFPFDTIKVRMQAGGTGASLLVGARRGDAGGRGAGVPTWAPPSVR
jgi:hypothetical protein